MIEIAPIPGHKVDALLKALTPHLERMEKASKGQHTVTSIYQAAIANELRLWVAYEGSNVFAVAGSRIIRWPNGDLVGAIDFVTGENPFRWARKGIAVIVEDLERQKCVRVQCDAGKWLRRFFDGFEVTHWRFDKEVAS